MFVIAEIGGNWSDFKEAMASVEAAAECGADAVKFQWYSHADLYGYGDEEKNLSLDQLGVLADLAHTYDIEFMCTPFHHDDVGALNPLVERHKIASSEMMYVDLLKAVVATKKPILLSTGGHDERQIKTIVDTFLSGRDFTIMYCCNAYPSTNHDLRWITEMADLYSCHVGYSDHSLDAFTPYVAGKHYGATVIEKHFKIRSDGSFPDDGHSLLPGMFAKMVDILKGSEKLFPLVGDDETDAIKMHNRRLIATKKLNTGDALQYNRNFGLYRSKKPSDMLDAGHIKYIDGRRATKHYNPGDVILEGGYK